MPPKPLKLGQKLAYPDWSTFVAAFQGSQAASSSAHVTLNQLLLRVAHEANLCFSLAHLWELLHHENAQKRVAMAGWLDQIDLVWLHSDNDVIRSEVRHAVLDAIRGTRTPPSVPAVPSFLSLFEGLLAERQALTYALGHSTLVDFVNLAASDPGFMENLNRFRKLSVESAKRLYDDRVQGLKQVDKRTIVAALDRKLRANLQVDALRAAESLRGEPASGFHVLRNGIFVAPTDGEVIAAVNGFPDLTALPFIFLFHRALGNMSFEITRRPNNQSRAFDRQRGAMYDQIHLVGAAYCDAFTCDTEMARWLDGGREALGRTSPITAAGGIEVLIQRIEEQLAK